MLKHLALIHLHCVVVLQGQTKYRNLHKCFLYQERFLFPSLNLHIVIVLKCGKYKLHWNDRKTFINSYSMIMCLPKLLHRYFSVTWEIKGNKSLYIIIQKSFNNMFICQFLLTTWHFINLLALCPFFFLFLASLHLCQGLLLFPCVCAMLLISSEVTQQNSLNTVLRIILLHECNKLSIKFWTPMNDLCCCSNL